MNTTPSTALARTSGVERLPESAEPRAWTPAQRNLMMFAGLAREIIQDGKTVTIVPDPGVAEAFITVCRRTGLDPFAKQIYAMEVNGRLSIVVGVDGFRVVAQRSQGYRGQIGPQWTADGVTWVDAWLPELQGGTKDDRPAAARIGILREGFDAPLWQVVTWAEFGMASRFKGDNWGVRPAHMLGIRAETHGLRRTFPNDLSGLYTPEDFDDVEQIDDEGGIRALVAEIEKITDLDELTRRYHELNSVGMPDSVRATIMAHAGALGAVVKQPTVVITPGPAEPENGASGDENGAGDPTPPDAAPEPVTAAPETDESDADRQARDEYAAYQAEQAALGGKP